MLGDLGRRTEETAVGLAWADAHLPLAETSRPAGRVYLERVAATMGRRWRPGLRGPQDQHPASASPEDKSVWVRRVQGNHVQPEPHSLNPAPSRADLGRLLWWGAGRTLCVSFSPDPVARSELDVLAAGARKSSEKSARRSSPKWKSSRAIDPPKTPSPRSTREKSLTSSVARPMSESSGPGPYRRG